MSESNKKKMLHLITLREIHSSPGEGEGEISRDILFIDSSPRSTCWVIYYLVTLLWDAEKAMETNDEGEDHEASFKGLGGVTRTQWSVRAVRIITLLLLWFGLIIWCMHTCLVL